MSAKAFSWVSRRNPELEARLVFEGPEMVDANIRRIGTNGIGVPIHLTKEAFMDSYQLRQVPA
jgi:hypothetical protein